MKLVVLSATLMLSSSPGGCKQAAHVALIEPFMTRSIAMWDQSCRGKLDANGLCVDAVEVANAAYCGGSHVRYASRRHAGTRDLRDAMDHFWQAYRMATPGARTQLAPLAAELRLRIGDDITEQLLLNPPPADLDLDPSKPDVAAESKARFSQWIADAKRAVQESAAAYRDAQKGSPATQARARARLSTAPIAMADQMSAMPIPVNVRTGPYAAEAIEAFCTVMNEAAVPLYERAAAASAAPPP